MTVNEPSSRRRAGRVKDARGKPVTLLDPYALNLLRRHDVIPAEPLNDIAGEIGSGWARKQQIACLTAWLLPLAAIAITWIAKWRRGIPLGVLERNIGAILIANFTLGVCIIWWWARRNRIKRVWKVMLKHLRCPHCGYDIRRLPVDPNDGATVCPECGCAWKMGDAGAVQPGGSDCRE